MVSKKIIAISVIVACAIVGAVIAILVAHSSGSDDSNTKDGDSRSGSDVSTSGGGDSGFGDSPSSDTSDGTSSGSGPSVSPPDKVSSDPTKAKFSVSSLAVGDWGATLEKDSCCTRSDDYNDFDVVAEDVVAYMMDELAGSMDPKPSLVLGHGDNFYWTGINSDDEQSSRFQKTFEDKFSGKNLAGIPWVNVMGNHDYGGSSYICSSDDGDLVVCKSADATIDALNQKFKWQQEYKSPDDDRWHMDDHFYTKKIKGDDGVSIEIFNLDTNNANTHGAQQICCQCYGYAEGDDDGCDNIARGDKYCFGGDTDKYDKCMKQFQEWGDDSEKKLLEKAKESDATWKIVNTHYSPTVHYDAKAMETWFKTIKEAGIHAWFYGHTHGEKHDFASSVKAHFFENGAGGGIQKSSASGIPVYAQKLVENKWSYNGREYGFFSLKASKDWLKVEYHSADKKWDFKESFDATTKGGVVTKYCYYVPNDGGEGKECESERDD